MLDREVAVDRDVVAVGIRPFERKAAPDSRRIDGSPSGREYLAHQHLELGVTKRHLGRDAEGFEGDRPRGASSHSHRPRSYGAPSPSPRMRTHSTMVR